MGVFSGPDISENGLVLALDAGNNKSHSTNRFISYGSGLVTENVTFSINGTGTFQRVASGTVIGGYEVKATDVVYSYVLGTNGCHYHGNSAPIPSGVRATFSVDYLVTGATNYPSNSTLIVFENYGGGALGGAAYVPNSLQNVWQRVTFTSGPTSSSGSQAMFLYPGGCGPSRLADSGTIYFRNPKVEWTNVDTGDGNFSSMPNLTTWYDLINRTNNGTLTNTPYHFINSDGTGGYMSFDGVDDYINSNLTLGTNATIEFTAKANWNQNNSGAPIPISIDSDNYSSGPQPFFSGGKINWNTGDSDSNPFSNSYIPDTNWHIFCISNNFSSGVATLYIDGVLIGTATALNMTTTGLNKLWIGRWHGGGYLVNMNLSTVKIYNRALTASEIQQNFNANRSRFGI